MARLTRSFSDSDLLSYFSYIDLSTNEYLCNSWPQLAITDDSSPPNYYQICSSELHANINLRRNQFIVQNNRPFFRSYSLRNNETNKQLFEDLDNIRRENFLLTSSVLKNNDDIKSLFVKYQLLINSIKQLYSENHKLEKKVCDLEEKLYLNMKEIRLMYDDFENLKQNLCKLNEKIHNKNNIDSVPNSCNCEASNLSLSSSYKELNARIAENEMKLIYQRIDKVEKQFNQMNINPCLDVHTEINKLTLKEDSNRKIEEKLQYMQDINQLLQWKVHMLESKIDQNHLLNSSITNHQSALPPQAKQNFNPFNNIITNVSANNMAINKPIKELELNNKPIIVPSAPIAYVTPNVLQSPPISITQPMVRRSISNETNRLMEDQLVINEYSSRRSHRRNHKIKMFSHRRRH